LPVWAVFLPAKLVNAQPVIATGGVLNAASYALRGLPHSDIAQGSMFVIFGQRMGPATLQQATSIPLPTTLAGTSIKVSGGGVTADAVMIYTSAGQVAAILPSRIPPGDATVTVTYNNQTSPPASIRVARSSFGIFTRNQAGSGPGIVQNYVSGTSQPVNARTDAAKPGQVMSLWGTGLGPVDFDETRPPQVRNLDVELEILVGGKSAKVLYKGRSPEFPGIDQLNFELPADVPLGCDVPLAIRAATVVSNFASIAIATNGGVCSDAVGLSAADMEKMRSGGQLRIAGVALNKTIVAELNGVLDGWSVDFSRYTHDVALKARSIGREAFESEAPPIPFGTCSVSTGKVKADDLDFPSDPVRPENLYGGPVLTLQGPRGTRQTTGDLGGQIPGFTDNYGPEFLVPGVYTTDNGNGGGCVGPYRATLTLPAPLEWTSQTSLPTVRRTQDLTVTWNGGDASKEIVVISGLSFDPTSEVGGAFGCVERASVGRFTVPAWVLSALPPSGLWPGTTMVKGMLGLNQYSILDATRFQAQGMDVAFFGYEITQYKFAKFE